MTVRTKVVVGLFALPGSEPDQTALDDDKALALRSIQGPQEISGATPLTSAAS